MKFRCAWWVILVAALFFAACSDSGDDAPASKGNNNNPGVAALPPIVVTSLDDAAGGRKAGVTLRGALEAAASGQGIVFDPSLDGGVVNLSIIGDEHTILKGEVMGMRDEPSGPVSYLEGYFERDYGKSALYARKDVVIDASALPSGITLAWTGGAADPARVLAVYGDLTMTNVSVTGGRSVAEALDSEAQPFTLGRGGGVAVWGKAILSGCRIYGNYCEGDFQSSRDRGAFGGGLYADIVEMDDCVVSGNTVLGGGAGGGGVCSAGGAEAPEKESVIRNSAITGNHISGLMAYGAGVYSDGGGIGNSKTLKLINCTIAQNLADASPGLPPFMLARGYWRGGGAYMSNGHMLLQGCTITDNEVHGVPRTDSLDKPNLAGGVAATIGNAHAVEDMIIGDCIITGNTVHETGGAAYDQDIFTGSLLYFRSMGCNRIGVIDFSQILVPVGERGWASLCRKHYPQQDDQDGVAPGDVLDLAGGVVLSQDIVSAGVNAGDPAVLHYEPQGSAVDKTPHFRYVPEVLAEYWVTHDGVDNFLAIMLDRLEDYYGLEGFAAQFTQDFENFLNTVDIDPDAEGLQPYTDPDGQPILTLAGALWFGPAETWNKELVNHPYIEFWHRLDKVLGEEGIPGMGPELLGDEAWQALFAAGDLEENEDITMLISSKLGFVVTMLSTDQLGAKRPAGVLGDIGAIELQE